MAPPQWAYLVESFEIPPDDELVCSICRCVFCEPVQCPCRHVFCKHCITKWLQRNSTCPVCRHRVTKRNLQEVVPIVKNMIMKLVLRCHNAENGCEERLTLENCENHLKVCKFELIQCKNKPCKQNTFRKDMGEHELNGCLHRYTKCEKCHLKISTLSPEKHDCIKELTALLRKKNGLIKKKNLRIKNLEDENRRLKEAQENQLPDSDDSSASSHDFVLNWTTDDASSEISTVESYNSDLRSSSLSSNDVFSILQDDYPIIHSTLMGDSHVFDISSSVEEARASLQNNDTNPSIITTASSEQNTTTEFPQNPDGPRRRPAKRRHTRNCIVSTDTSGSDPDDIPPLPCSKRCWSAQNSSGASGFSTNASFFTPTSTASETAAESSPPVRQASQNESVTTEDGSNMGDLSASSSSAGRRAFERTLALFEMYDIDSDPEWLPPADYSVPAENANANVSDVSIESSSSSDSSSSSQSGDFNAMSSGDLPVAADIILHRFSSESGESDDPNWFPISKRNT